MEPDLEVSVNMKKWGNKPCYRYIRAADKLPPTLPEEARPMARIHLFDISSTWEWYISSYDPETRMAFGLVHGWEWEYGYIDMVEITEYEGRMLGLPIERDKMWKPIPLRDVEYAESQRRETMRNAREARGV